MNVGHLSHQLTVQPTLPALLTKTRPTKDLHLIVPYNHYDLDNGSFAYLKFENKVKPIKLQYFQSFALPDITAFSPCYPERNFEGNQLPNCSMGLSPLYSTLTSDLHVSTAGGLPSEFPPTSTNSSIIHNLSGPSIFARTHCTSKHIHNYALY